MSVQLTLPIVAVTLMEDRAFVRRHAQLELEPGSHRFSVPSISPIVADKTLHGQLSGTAGKVLDLRMVRRPRMPDQRPSTQAQELWARLKSEREAAAAEEREMGRLLALLSSYDSLLQQWAEETARDASFAQVDTARWNADWQALQSRLAEVAQRHEEARQRLTARRRALESLSQQHELLTTPSSALEAHLELTIVMVEKASVELTVEYAVPNACWRPYHVAEWSQQDRLRFRGQACLWQNTGESWDNVRLSFSTERSALGTEPPPLDRDILQLQPKSKRTQATVHEEAVVRLQQASGVPGIDAGEEALRYTSPAGVSVPSDGQPHRVPLFEFEASVREEKVLMGEMGSEVLVRTELENGAKGPILAGPVDLIKSCGLVGRGYLQFAAAGETFSINWGPHPELRSHRVKDTTIEERPLLSGWTTRRELVEIHLSNLGPSTLSLQVRERIPVSELKSVKVEQDLAKTTGKVSQDSNGFVTFAVDLEPFGRRTVTLAYLVSSKWDVAGV